VGPVGDEQLQYPLDAQQRALQGRLWATVRYAAPDQAPEVQLHHRDQAEPFAAGVKAWLLKRRMPCMQGEPVTANMKFIFRLEGDSFGFKPLTLLQYMGRTAGLKQQQVQFDTTTMGCPFDLRLDYLQPNGSNRVGELGESNPARRPLLEWLANSSLALAPAQLDAVYADTADIHVACIKIDLKPQEKTS
jgi:hypothetical protein